MIFLLLNYYKFDMIIIISYDLWMCDFPGYCHLDAVMACHHGDSTASHNTCSKQLVTHAVCMRGGQLSPHTFKGWPKKSNGEKVLGILLHFGTLKSAVSWFEGPHWCHKVVTESI